jgi:hypothetical protein
MTFPESSGCYCVYDTISVDAAVASLNPLVQDGMEQAVPPSFHSKFLTCCPFLFSNYDRGVGVRVPVGSRILSSTDRPDRL